MMSDNYKRIGIGWLHNQAFCEYQLYLKWVKGLEDIPTTETIKGAKEHKVKEISSNISLPKLGIKPIESPITSYKEAKIKGISFFATEFGIECNTMMRY
jgi:hypothetical protein